MENTRKESYFNKKKSLNYFKTFYHIIQIAKLDFFKTLIFFTGFKKIYQLEIFKNKSMYFKNFIKEHQITFPKHIQT